MTASPPRYSREETARLGQEIYARDIQPLLEATYQGQFAAIDIETGTFEFDRDDYTATENLLAQNPGAQIWLARVGRTTAYQIGGPRSVTGRGRT